MCVGYKIDGKTTDEIPPQDCGFRKIEPNFTKMPGWCETTVGISEHDKLPKKAQEYMRFLQTGNAGQDRHDFHGPGAQPDYLDRRVRQRRAQAGGKRLGEIGGLWLS